MDTKTLLKGLALCLAVSSVALSAPAKNRPLRLETANLSFEVSADGSRAAFLVKGREEAAVRDNDFWRLILDDGQRTEMPVLSSQQKGKAVLKNGVITVEYKELLSEWGDTFPVLFRLEICVEDGLFKFTPYVENHTQDVRVNECQAPYACFTEIAGDKEKDALFLPRALGRKIDNPWGYMASQTPLYYAHDEYETVISMPYPRASMTWYGVQSGDKFLYVARYDPDARYCFLSVRQRIHYEPCDLMLGINHLPMARPGEKVNIASTSIGLLDGDWRAGADRYRAWADATFFKVVPKADWVRELTGWQRLVFRLQFGRDLFKPTDLPHIYEVGKRYGINTVFIFGWWKEGMDRAYPKYEEPYPGAFKDLKENIKKVQDMGGHVILECNCHFLDPESDFYKEFGRNVELLDINGNEIRAQFGYAGRGEFRANWGKVQFPLVCTCTPLWRNQVLSQLKFMGDEMGAQCVFADCYGGCPYQPCFNHVHEHGWRIDEEAAGKRKFFADAEAYSDAAGHVLATECVTDVAAAYTQFIHGGLTGQAFTIKGDDFPQMFRYTFPEVITTNRGVRCSEGQYDRQLKYAMLTGVRMDAELFTCRATLDADEKYAEVIKYCADCLTEHRAFFFDGRFTVLDTAERPYYLKMAEYYNADGSQVMRVLYNASYHTDATFRGVILHPDEMRFDVFDTDAYLK